jgi:DNA-binding transcriptional ArsR family regulator
MSTTTGSDQRSRGVEEAISYAVGHRIRVEVLASLNEGVASASELARVVHQPLSTVTHHIEELLKSGSIEVAKTERIRNISQNFYRAVELPFFTDEQMEAMPPAARQEIYGVILQAVMAEALAAFWAGKITADPRAWLSWRWFNVDAQGREDIAEEQSRSWGRLREIEAESATRRARSGEEPVSIIVSSLGHERCRTAMSPPVSFGNR